MEEVKEEVKLEEKQTVYNIRPPWRAFISIPLGAIIAASCMYGALFSYKMPDVLASFKIYIYILPIALILFSLLTTTVARYSRLYTITDSEICVRYGLLRRDVRTARYEKITDIWMKQNFVERLLNIATIKCNTAGTAGYEIVLSDIYDPIFYSDLIREKMGGRGAQ